MRPAGGRGAGHAGLLWAACALLPRESREDQFNEWHDEIQCARESGLSAGRRATSIAFRSAPQLAWRARRPWRTRRSSHARQSGMSTAGVLGKRIPRSIQGSWALTAGRSGWAKALAVASVVALADLSSKALVSGSVLLFERQHPFPHLTIFHLHNPGLSLTFIDGGIYVPASLAIIGVGVVLLSLIAGPPQPRQWLVIGLMVGGGIGNLSERLYHGYVTDFLQIGAVPAVFNLADVAIALAFLLSCFLNARRARSTGNRRYRSVAAGSSLP